MRSGGWRRGLQVAFVFLSIASGARATELDQCPTPADRSAESLTIARECVIALEAELGPDSRALLPELSRLGRWFSAQAGAPSGARFFHRRALRLARSLDGPESRSVADASLQLARAEILSGRCRGYGPDVADHVSTAETAYSALPPGDPARRTGLEAVARAFADLLDYAEASRTLTSMGPSSPEEWELLGGWRARSSDLGGAVEAWLMAADLSSKSDRRRQRVLESARRAAFALGDRDILRKISELQ